MRGQIAQRLAFIQSRVLLSQGRSSQLARVTPYPALRATAADRPSHRRASPCRCSAELSLLTCSAGLRSTRVQKTRVIM
eukprot:6180624-Pleurochrysis_carterae.AAC.1